MRFTFTPFYILPDWTACEQNFASVHGRRRHTIFVYLFCRYIEYHAYKMCNWVASDGVGQHLMTKNLLLRTKWDKKKNGRKREGLIGQAKLLHYALALRHSQPKSRRSLNAFKWECVECDFVLRSCSFLSLVAVLRFPIQVKTAPIRRD